MSYAPKILAYGLNLESGPSYPGSTVFHFASAMLSYNKILYAIWCAGATAEFQYLIQDLQRGDEAESISNSRGLKVIFLVGGGGGCRMEQDLQWELVNRSTRSIRS